MTSKADFQAWQAASPIVISMGSPEQRALVTD
jgi:hypothetical protein